MRTKAVPNQRQSPSKTYVSNTQLVRGHQPSNFTGPQFKGQMVRSQIGEELGYSTAPHMNQSMGMQGRANYGSAMQWPASGGVHQPEKVNVQPTGNQRQGPMIG